MIAGATCTDCSIGMYMAFSKTPVFSHKQSVTAYDKGANGMLIGEGSVMFVLKKLDHAIADGDKARACLCPLDTAPEPRARLHPPRVPPSDPVRPRPPPSAPSCLRRV